MPKCISCRKQKPVSEFYANSYRECGRDERCKMCKDGATFDSLRQPDIKYMRASIRVNPVMGYVNIYG